MTTSDQRSRLERAVVWRGHTVIETLDLCRLHHGLNPRKQVGWQLRGTTVVRVGEELAEVNYFVDCDPMWHTRHASVYFRPPAQGKQVLVIHEGGWKVRGPHPADPDEGMTVEGQLETVRDDLHGCEDVDIGMTPSTNTLPIRRLNLAVGESADVTAAWVRFPELTVEPLAQRYTRLDERRYRYESASGFVAELEVDELGLVVRYGDIWERVGG